MRSKSKRLTSVMTNQPQHAQVPSGRSLLMFCRQRFKIDCLSSTERGRRCRGRQCVQVIGDTTWLGMGIFLAATNMCSVERMSRLACSRLWAVASVCAAAFSLARWFRFRTRSASRRASASASEFHFECVFHHTSRVVCTSVHLTQTKFVKSISHKQHLLGFEKCFIRIAKTDVHYKHLLVLKVTPSKSWLCELIFLKQAFNLCVCVNSKLEIILTS